MEGYLNLVALRSLYSKSSINYPINYTEYDKELYDKYCY